MTNKITIKASEVQVEDHVYSGHGANAHPTFAWETVTQIKNEDGLILLITGDLKGLHGEFWLEPDEEITVIRYPKVAEAAKPLPKSHHKPAH
jgi:hypothetical protein